MSIEKEKLINIINKLPDEIITEVIDYAEFLQQKKEKRNDLDLNKYTEKIISEDSEVLKKLAE